MVSVILFVLRMILWGWRKAPPVRKIVNFILVTHQFRRYRKSQQLVTAITAEDVFNVVQSAKVKKGYGTCIVFNCAIVSGREDTHEDILASMVAFKLIDENFCFYLVSQNLDDFDADNFYYQLSNDIRLLANRGLEHFKKQYPKEARKRCSWYSKTLVELINSNSQSTNYEE